ncbi:hypothetical protein ACFV5G_09435 [Streptomyces sp. NPDC059766]|uniref:DUF7144 family membrane protein n=1 Tax=Streptomyces sp. NPDC059766 TaxID=3346940 RepID=UPI00364A0CF1
MSEDAAHPTGDPGGDPGAGPARGPGGARPEDIGTAWNRPPDGTAASREPDSWVSGGVTFAGVLMLCSGVLSALQGISAIARDDVFVRTGDYVYAMDLTGWGWIHLIIGVLLAVTGGGLLKGMAWARIAGICFAALSLVAQFLFLPYAVFWPITMIAIDLFVIWALLSRQEGAG